MRRLSHRLARGLHHVLPGNPDRCPVLLRTGLHLNPGLIWNTLDHPSLSVDQLNWICALFSLDAALFLSRPPLVPRAVSLPLVFVSCAIAAAYFAEAVRLPRRWCFCRFCLGPLSCIYFLFLTLLFLYWAPFANFYVSRLLPCLPVRHSFLCFVFTLAVAYTLFLVVGNKALSESKEGGVC